MNKSLAGLFGIVIICVLLWFGLSGSQTKHNKLLLGTSPTSTPAISLKPQTVTSAKTIFIPYWTVGNNKIDDSNYSQLVYFGIAGTVSGIDTNDPGYKNIDLFLTNTDQTKKRLLAVRMVDSNVNAQVLANKQMQTNIATESASLAKDKGFDGVVLDLEISAIRFDSVVKSISDFASLFASKVHDKQLLFDVIIYGDTFYRLRPYDVSHLAGVSDNIMIMAYDLHKADADPGADFPLQGDEYNLKQMTTDFLHAVPANKLTVLFGMYGYDWTIDDKGQTIGTAKSITLVQAKQKFFPCNLKDCAIKRVSMFTETEVMYLDDKNNKHDVWFEDESSVGKKMEFLKSKGINSIGYWAYGYF